VAATKIMPILQARSGLLMTSMADYIIRIGASRMKGEVEVDIKRLVQFTIPIELEILGRQMARANRR
jgi:hypothetical protein